MNNISKKIENVIIVEGNKEELKKYLEEIKRRNISLISVQFPKNKEKLSTSFVNSNWNVSKYKLEDVIFFAKCENGKYMFAFNNEKFIYRLTRTVEKMELNAQRFYLKKMDQKAVIEKEIFERGSAVRLEVTYTFNANKYSVARCFA